MAVLQLIRGSNTINLHGGTDGFDIRYDGWFQNRASQDEDGSFTSVEEVFTLKAVGSDMNDLITKLQNVDRELWYANRYTNRAFSQVDPVYLRVKLDNESQWRQALVLNGTTRPDTGLMSKPVSQNSSLRDFRMILTRHPFWSDIINRSPIGPSDNIRISTMGGSLTTTGEVFGDVPGRLHEIYFSWPSSTLAAPLQEVWAGFRSDTFGEKELFSPNWDCGDSDNDVHNNAVIDSRAYTYNGKVVYWSPQGGADNAMLPRVTIRMANITNQHDHQNGTFLVLCRARTTGGGDRVYRMRLLSGHYDSSSSSKWRTGSRIQVPASGVAAGTWYYYPMGIITIPAVRVDVSSVLIRNFALRLEAELVSGTNNWWEADLFTLIPIEEGFAHIKGAYIDQNYQAYIRSSPDGETIAFNESTTSDHHRTLEFDTHNFSIPTGGCRFVVAAQAETAHNWNQTANTNEEVLVYFSYYSNWLTARGSF